MARSIWNLALRNGPSVPCVVPNLTIIDATCRPRGVKYPEIAHWVIAIAAHSCQTETLLFLDYRCRVATDPPAPNVVFRYRMSIHSHFRLGDFLNPTYGFCISGSRKINFGGIPSAFFWLQSPFYLRAKSPFTRMDHVSIRVNGHKDIKDTNI